MFQRRNRSQVKHPRKVATWPDKIKLMVNLRRCGETHICWVLPIKTPCWHSAFKSYLEHWFASHSMYGFHSCSQSLPWQNVPAAGNFAIYMYVQLPTCKYSWLFGDYFTLNFTGRPVGGDGTWHLRPATPAMLPAATKHFDRAVIMM